mgnify:FL=1
MLGASNLARSLAHGVMAARTTLGVPLSIHVAMGHGRSYGVQAGWIGKKFSGIFSCDLWRVLECDSTSPTVAFVTDVGNDLAYEIPFGEILGWVETCIARLLRVESQVVLTELSLGPLERMSQSKFIAFRALCYPRSRLTRVEMLDRARALNAGLVELARSQKTSVFSVPNAWYGLDPLHPRRAHLREYWQTLFALSTGRQNSLDEEYHAWMLRGYLRLLVTAEHISRHPSQPSCRRTIVLRDGTSIAIY